MRTEQPKILCLSGHDPTGGAGIQADIETIAALDGHALTVITAYTVQDTANVVRVTAPDPSLFKAQIETLLADGPIQAVKIGLLGSAGQIPEIVKRVRRLKVPVVLDPVLRAGGGVTLVSRKLPEALIAQLLPHVEVLTPNAAEARLLVPQAETLEACGTELLRRGAKHVLITGGDEPGETVVNLWCRPGRAPRRFVWPRLPGRFHGAGCTLAAAIAVLLARGYSLNTALQDAQTYAHESLKRARSIGRGRPIPGRFP